MAYSKVMLESFVNFFCLKQKKGGENEVNINNNSTKNIVVCLKNKSSFLALSQI